MSDSLKDQLLALGFKAPPKSAAPAAKSGQGHKTGPATKAGPPGKRAAAHGAGTGRPEARRDDRRPARPPAERARGAARDAAEIDLAKAYALRARLEREEKERLDREAAEKARLKAERKAQVAKLLDGAELNLVEAEHPRNFEYSGKIRRVYVDAAQLAAINRGELGVVQHKGRFLVVTCALAREVHAIEPALLALLVDPDSASPDDVPPDLVW